MYLTQQDPKAFVALQPLWALPLPLLLECLGGFGFCHLVSVPCVSPCFLDGESPSTISKLKLSLGFFFFFFS